MTTTANVNDQITKGPFSPDWESLKNHTCPEWFRDAKFGIWAHWGPQAVPQIGDWYARKMYIEDDEFYKYHCEHYGHPSEFGYKDIVKLWKAEQFDAEALVKLYKQTGARYIVSMAVHHDNFDLWNSKHHRWNAVEMGPRLDVVGQFREAALKHGLRFGVTEHLERAYSWFNTNKGSDKEGAFAGIPYDGANPELAEFYLEAHEDTSMEYPRNPSEAWKEHWYLRIKDLVEQYNPDLLYTDGGIPFEEIGRAMVANFYNNNLNHNGGSLEAVYAYKNMFPHHGEYVEGVGLLDMERGVVNKALEAPWQTDTCLGDWYYKKGMEYKTAETVIHMLIDIVSKNGNLLLNVPLKPDGSLDEQAKDIVKGIGEWIAINGEAIYDTRPWNVYGEGPTRSDGGQFNEDKVKYTSEDLRFTQKGSDVFAIGLSWPENGEFLIQSFDKATNYQVSSVELLGHSGVLNWEQTSEGLRVQLPKQKPCEYAYALKIKA